MYKKDLTETVRLRLSPTDMDFLRNLSEERSSSISECIRSIIGEYRRSVETLSTLTRLVDITKEAQLSYGDTITDFDDKL